MSEQLDELPMVYEGKARQKEGKKKFKLVLSEEVGGWRGEKEEGETTYQIGCAATGTKKR